MTQLSAEAKEAIVQQALTRKGKSVASIAKMNGIGGSTLHKWLRKARMGESFLTVNESAPDSKAEQLRHLIATAKLDDEALGVYCRQHGLYSHQLTQWKVNFMSDTPSVKQHSAQAELKQVKAENKRLKKELQRKEKALAEASTLLILKKKASSIWGENEDD